jgi:hypothetical protein
MVERAMLMVMWARHFAWLDFKVLQLNVLDLFQERILFFRVGPIIWSHCIRILSRNIHMDIYLKPLKKLSSKLLYCSQKYLIITRMFLRLLYLLIAGKL